MAPEIADVRIIYVAVHGIGYVIPANFSAQRVGRGAYRSKLRPSRLEQMNDLFFSESRARPRLAKNSLECFAESDRWGSQLPYLVRRHDAFLSRRPIIGPRKALGID